MAYTSTDAGASALKEFLNTSLDDRVPRGTTNEVFVEKRGPVAVVNCSDSLTQTMRMLCCEGFSSAPVLDYDGHTFVGFITMLDLVKFVSNLFWADTEEAWVNFFQKRDDLRNKTVHDVMKKPTIWDRDPYPPMLETYSHLHALESFAKGPARQLVVLSSKTGRIHNLITRSMMVSFIRQRKHLCPSLMQRKVCEFSIYNEMVKKAVISVKQTDKAINAFTKMHTENVTGLAMLDNTGILVGAFTQKDLRGIGPEGKSFSRLFKTVADYKLLTQQEYPMTANWVHFDNKPVPLTALYVTPDSTFENVLDAMNDGNLHRVFVCSTASHQAGRPTLVGVLSQKEVCAEAFGFMMQ